MAILDFFLTFSTVFKHKKCYFEHEPHFSHGCYARGGACDCAFVYGAVKQVKAGAATLALNQSRD